MAAQGAEIKRKEYDVRIKTKQGKRLIVIHHVKYEVDYGADACIYNLEKTRWVNRR